MQVIRPSVLHLMRGQLYDICGKRIFTMGGASSHDIRDGILEPDDPDYCADQIHHGALPCHVHFILDETPSVNLPGLPRELATMRSRNISCSAIIQNMAQIKELYKDSWETIPGNSDTLLYLGGNEVSTHKYISEALGKSTIDTKTHGQTKGRSGSYSTDFQMSGRDMP